MPVPLKKSNSGFTLIEVLIAAAIVAVVGVAITGTIALFLKYNQIAKEKLQAQNIANQQIELFRNMPYDSLATVAGSIYPPGTLPDLQTVTVDNQQFKVHTIIDYVDDPYDGNALGTIPGKPRDFYPYDYKRVTIIVKDRYDQITLAELNTNFAAKAAETASNTGILALRVQNSQGLPVSNATVVLTNPNPVPPVNINTFTDNSGLVVIPNLPPSSNNDYHVVASLSGYSTDSTNPIFAPNNLNPVNPDFNILTQQITNVTLAIDVVGSMEIHVVDTSGTAVPSLILTVTSNKLTYTNPTTYKFNQNFTTNASGTIDIANVEWDSYHISLPAGYYLVTSSPYQDVGVNAGQSVTINLVVSTLSSYPTITKVAPTSGVNNSTVSFTITGTNLVSGTTVKLQMSGQPDINATGLVSSNGNTQLNGTFDLTGAAAGNWDLVVTDLSSRVARQAGGFTISVP